MTENELHSFYKAAVLPQFELIDGVIVWAKSIQIGPDENAHPFALNGQQYILIFEDHGGLALQREFIEKQLQIKPNEYDYVHPITQDDMTPSYTGFHLPTPYKYVPGVTGTFTLLHLRAAKQFRSI